MNLSELKFAVDTKALEDARTLITGLVQDFSKLDRASQVAAKNQAQIEKLQAQTRKANADAAAKETKRVLDLDKVEQDRLSKIEKSKKAEIAALEKAEKAKQALLDKQAAAQERALQQEITRQEKFALQARKQQERLAAQQEREIAKRVSLLEREREVTDLMAQGYSRADAKFFAMAKSAGQFSDELVKLRETQRAMTTDPFDQSDSSLKRMTRSLHEASQAQNLFNSGSMLTVKQAREMIRDQDRLILNLQRQGKSTEDINAALQSYRTEYEKVASQLNQAASAEQKIIKARQEAVSATKYLTLEDEKMAAALNASNIALDKAASDKLVKYEAALRKSGMSQELATARLAKYKVQLEQVQAQEQKRAADFLSRAISPQLTDIAVSLYSGQAPLTVLLQQGGQLSDLFRQSGVEAGNLGKLMKESFYGMIPVIKEVGSSLAGLATGVLLDLGSAATRTTADLLGITFVSDKLKRALASGGEENFKYIGTLNRIGETASKVAAVGIASVVVILATLALEYKKILATEKELSIALATSGGAMAMSKDQAVAYAEGMQSIGVGTIKAMQAMTEFTKVGKVGAEGLDEIVKASLAFQKYTGVAIEDTAKQYKALQDEPSKALRDIAEKTGVVNSETLDLIRNTEQQGDKVKAAEIATRAYTQALTDMAAEAKQSLSPVELLWIDIKSAIGKVSQTVYELATANEVVGVMRTVWETVAVIVSEVWYTIKGVGKEIGGVAAQIAAVLRGDFAGAKTIGEQMSLDAKKAREEQEKLVESILDRGKADQKNYSENKAQNSQYAGWLKENEKALERQYTKAEKFALKEKQLQQDRKDGLIDEAKYNAAIAGWKRIILGEKEPKPDRQVIKDLETQIDLENERLGLLASFNNQLDSIERTRKATGNEEQYQKSLNALIEKQPIYLERQKEINAAHELSNRLFGKADMLGKDYYKTLEQISREESSGLRSPENAEKARQAAFDQTELAKEQLKYITASTEASQKYSAEVSKSLGENTQENLLLDNRIALLGLTSEEARLLSREQDRKNKLLKVELEYQAKILDIKNNEKLDPFNREIALIDAAKVRAEQEKTINREVAIQYAEDLDKEIQGIKKGVSDSIVTALFEGGKAGSKKLRDTVVDAFKKRISVVVDVGVNALLNGAIGGISSLFSGGANSAASASSAASGIGSIWNLGSKAVTTFLGSGSAAGGAAAAGSSAIGSAMSVAGPAIAAAIAIYSIAKALDDSGTYHTGGAAQYSAFGGLTSGQSGAAYDIGFGKVEAGQSTISAMETLSKSLVGIFDGIAKTFGKTAGYEVATAFADDTSKDGAWGALGIKLSGVEILNWDDFRQSRWAPKEFADGEEGYKQYLAAVAKDTRKILMDMDLPSWANKILSDLGDSASIESLSSAIQQIAGIRTVFENLKITFAQLSNVGDNTLESLMNLSGGIDALSTAASTYYQNFYSDAEKTVKLQNDVTRALSQYGLSLPATKEAYRLLVESQDVTTEQGAKNYVALIQNAGMFSELIAMQDELANAEKDRLEESLVIQRELLAQRSNLEIELLRAQGKAAEADAAERQLAIAGYNEAEIALYDYNKSLEKQIQSLQDAASANAELKSSFNDVRSTLTSTISTLTSELTSLNKYRSELLSGKALTSSVSYGYAQSAFGKSLSEVMSGSGSVSNLISDADQFLAVSKSTAKTQFEYLLDVQKVLQGTKQAQGSIVGQLDTAQKQLNALETISSKLGIIADNTQPKTLEDVLNGISGTGGNFSLVKDLYASLGRSGFGSSASNIDTEGFAFWLAAASTMSADMLKTEFNKSASSVSASASPVSLVSPAMLSPSTSVQVSEGSTGNYVTSDKFDRLVAEMEASRYEQRATAFNTEKMAKILDRITSADKTALTVVPAE